MNQRCLRSSALDALITCALMSVLAGMAGSGFAAQNEPSALEVVLVDMMRWQHLERTRPLFMSSRDWQEQCDLFRLPEWQTKCAEALDRTRNAEEEARTLLSRFALEPRIRQRGWIAVHMSAGEKAQDEHDPQTVAWLSVAEKMLGRIAAHNLDQCADRDACTVFFHFDRDSLDLVKIEAINHSPPGKHRRHD